MAFAQLLRLTGRLLPARARQGVKARLRNLVGPVEPSYLPRRSAPAILSPQLNIIGYVRSEHGVGESARSCARAATAAGIPFALYDYNRGNAARTSDDTWSSSLSTTLAPGINICHVNADQTPLLHATLGRECFEGRYTIGHWAWELPEFPDRWIGSFGLVDEVWAISQFVADAVSRKSPVPVIRMPLCVQFETEATAKRSDFNLPEGRFLFLSMYDTQSFQERKNPEAAIAAFRQAFPEAGEAGLVIKINHPDTHPDKVAALKAALAGVPGVTLIDRTMTRQAVFNLLALCNAYVSLHRAEGFGLGLAEAMFLGKPVVATHWSGNVDFMTVSNSCPVGYELVKLEKTVGPYEKGQTWAEPDVEHAAWHMKKLVAESAIARKIGDRGRETIRTQFSPAAVGRLYQQRLEVIGRMSTPLAA